MFKYAESYVKQTFSLFFKIKDQRNSVLKYYSLLCYANLCFYIDRVNEFAGFIYQEHF